KSSLVLSPVTPGLGQAYPPRPVTEASGRAGEHLKKSGRNVISPDFTLSLHHRGALREDSPADLRNTAHRSRVTANQVQMGAALNEAVRRVSSVRGGVLEIGANCGGRTKPSHLPTNGASVVFARGEGRSRYGG